MTSSNGPKPVIYFDVSNSQVPVVGKRCHVHATTPHPKITYTNYIITSLVHSVNDDGSFVTCNSIYKPDPESAIDDE